MPQYPVVTWPLSGMCTSTRARNSNGSTVSVPAVGPGDFGTILRHHGSTWRAEAGGAAARLLEWAAAGSF